MPNLVQFLSCPNEDVKNAILFVIYKALRADVNLRGSLKEAGAVAPLQTISKSTDKRISSFASYMLQVISK